MSVGWANCLGDFCIRLYWLYQFWPFYRVCSMFCQKWHNLLPLQPFERVRQKSALGTTTFWTSSGLPVCMPPFFVVMPCALHFKEKSRLERRKVGIWAELLTPGKCGEIYHIINHHFARTSSPLFYIEMAQLEALDFLILNRVEDGGTLNRKVLEPRKYLWPLWLYVQGEKDGSIS